MNSFRNSSIKRKQVLIIMAITTVALLVASVGFTTYEVVAFRSALVGNLSTLAEIIGNNTAGALDFNDPKVAEETLSALKAESHIIGACVYSADGKVFAIYTRPASAGPFTPPPRPPAVNHAFQKENLTLSRSIVSKGDVAGTVYLVSDMAGLYSRLGQYAFIIAAVLVLTLVVALVLSSKLQRFISAPILRLASAARAVGQNQDYSIRVEKQNPDEIGDLIDGFNGMLRQLQLRDKELQKSKDVLEARVQERTSELAAANVALQQENLERKRAEESLRLLGSAVEQANESILITDAQLDPPGPRIVFVNPAFTLMTGYTAEEVLGKTPRLLQGARTDKAVLGRLRDALSRGEGFRGETVNYHKDGSEFDLEWQVAPIRDSGAGITHFVAIQRDISDRRRLEARMFQSQKMETVGKLAGGIAHEFNSILTAIIGQCELLLGDLPPGGRSAKSAVEISQAAGRAATLTRQLLAYGRKQFLHPETLDLNRVIAGMEGVIHLLIGGDVATQVIPAPDLRQVKADTGQIEQVIMNMVINARDAMPNGGKLTLETANVGFDEESVGRYPELKAGDYVMLAITDTGAGMSEQVKARLFEPFFTTKIVGQGTGLGLSTCYGIIKQSGGHISVYSEVGRGATFKIYLPQMEEQAKVTVGSPASPVLSRGTETILLVEDDPALREMAGTLLRRLGYKVWAAANGVEALSLKQQSNVGHIDLLFTDVVMPHMSGKELADRVRSLYPYTRILFTSAYTENATIHQGVLDKGVALLQKPYTPSALARKVREVLEQARTPESTL